MHCEKSKLRRSEGAISASSGIQAIGFTLVELLVVISIIALLIGILLPSLSKARQSAQRAACAAKLQQMMVAANSFVNDHKGYYPLAGYLSGSDGTFNAAALNDPYYQNYAYMAFSPNNSGNDLVNLLAPITFALGSEMGYTKNLSAWSQSAQIYGDSDKLNVIRHFLCPSQASDVGQLLQYSWLYAGQINLPGAVGGEGYGEAISYIFNEGVLGYDEGVPGSGEIFTQPVGSGRLKGKASSVRLSSKVMFAADGLAGATTSRQNGAWVGVNFGPTVPPGPYSNLTVWNFTPYGPITLSDALTHRLNPKTGKTYGGDPQNFDQMRHKGKMNIAFCDGHVELRSIPAFTIANRSNPTPVMGASDPQATSLMDVYILPP